MNFEDIKKGKVYVAKKEWRKIKDNELYKYIELKEEPQQWPHDWLKFKWLMSGIEEDLPIACIEREPNRKEKESILWLFKI